MCVCVEQGEGRVRVYVIADLKLELIVQGVQASPAGLSREERTRKVTDYLFTVVSL